MTRRAFLALFLVVTLTAGCATLSLVETVASLIKEARELLTAGRYDEAIGKLLRAVEKDPKSWEAWLYLARSYIGKGAWADAITSGRKAFELAAREPDVVKTFGEALLGGGVDALKRGQLTDAIARLGEYVRVQPGDANGFLQLGRSLLGAGRFGDALDALLKGLGTGGDAGVRTELVRALLDGSRQALGSGDARAAAGLLREYVRVEPGNVSAWLELGKSLWSSGQRGEAMSAFRRVLELAPGHDEALRFMIRQ